MLFQTCMAFCCETQNKEFWEMSQWFILYKWSYMFDYQILIFSLMFHRRKKVIQVWNYMKVSKWWQNFHFCVNYLFKLWCLSASSSTVVRVAKSVSFALVFTTETPQLSCFPLNEKQKDGFLKRVFPSLFTVKCFSTHVINVTLRASAVKRWSLTGVYVRETLSQFCQLL